MEVVQIPAPGSLRDSSSGQRRETFEQRSGPAPQQQALSLASFALSPGLQSRHPRDRGSQNTMALLHFKWQPCWSSPLCQKLRVKMQGKQTSLCVKNACPLPACQHSEHRLSPLDGGRVMAEGGVVRRELRLFSKGLCFCFSKTLYDKPPLKVQM